MLLSNPPDTNSWGDIVSSYWIWGIGPRRPFGDYVRFLWGDQDCDTDGDAVTPQDRNWTELTVISRGANPRRVDVVPSIPYERSTMTLAIRSDENELAARLAYALAVSSGGDLSENLGGPAIAPETLVSRMGEFDLQSALDALR